jgi:hypothetical protein
VNDIRVFWEIVAERTKGFQSMHRLLKLISGKPHEEPDASGSDKDVTWEVLSY